MSTCTEPAAGSRRRRGAALLLAAGLLAGDAQAATSAPASTVRLELPLAQDPDIYLAIDPRALRIDVRARGLVLDSRSLAAIAFDQRRRLFGGDLAALVLPAVFRVVEEPQAAVRRRIAPDRLAPYSDDAASAPPVAADASHPVPETYSLRLSDDLELCVDRRLPGTLGRLSLAIENALMLLRGGRPPASRRIVLAVDGATAQWLHHRLRQGTALLIAAP